MKAPKRHLHPFLLLPAVALLAACGGTKDPKPPEVDGSVSAGPLLPVAVGNSWTYRVTENGVASSKTTTFGEKEPVGGTGPHASDQAYKVVTSKAVGATDAGAGDRTESWQAVEGSRVVRYRELAFGARTGALELDEHWDPSKLHVDGSDERTREGAQWLEEYKETKTPATGSPTTVEAHDLWTVVTDSEEVTVPAGTFQAIVLRKTGGSTTKTYWYARGVGKVKETGGQTEELESYEVAE